MHLYGETYGDVKNGGVQVPLLLSNGDENYVMLVIFSVVDALSYNS